MKKLNKHGELGVGSFLFIAISIIVCLVIFQTVSQNVGKITAQNNLTNGLYTMPSNGSCIDLVGQSLLNTAIITNRTSGGTVAATNYTIASGVSTTDNLLRLQLCSKLASVNPFAGQTINVTYQYGAEGYIDNSGARAITGIIVILAALAIAMIAFLGVRNLN